MHPLCVYVQVLIIDFKYNVRKQVLDIKVSQKAEQRNAILSVVMMIMVILKW